MVWYLVKQKDNFIFTFGKLYFIRITVALKPFLAFITYFVKKVGGG